VLEPVPNESIQKLRIGIGLDSLWCRIVSGKFHALFVSSLSLSSIFFLCVPSATFPGCKLDFIHHRRQIRCASAMNVPSSRRKFGQADRSPWRLEPHHLRNRLRWPQPGRRQPGFTTTTREHERDMGAGRLVANMRRQMLGGICGDWCRFGGPDAAARPTPLGRRNGLCFVFAAGSHFPLSVPVCRQRCHFQPGARSGSHQKLERWATCHSYPALLGLPQSA